VATYTYNGDGLRVGKVAGGVSSQFTWDAGGGLPQLVKEGAPGAQKSYVYGPGGLPVEQVTAAGATYYYHHDQLGSTRALTDVAGALQETYSFDAYGNTTAVTGSISNPLLYSGQYKDSESGFYYLRARYYDPSTAQFLSRDPAAAFTLSPYAYVNGSPLNSTDPSGDDPIGGKEFGYCILRLTCMGIGLAPVHYPPISDQPSIHAPAPPPAQPGAPPRPSFNPNPNPAPGKPGIFAPPPSPSPSASPQPEVPALSGSGGDITNNSPCALSPSICSNPGTGPITGGGNVQNPFQWFWDLFGYQTSSGFTIEEACSV
jgi:RHS repeat-associated protein